MMLSTELNQTDYQDFTHQAAGHQYIDGFRSELLSQKVSTIWYLIDLQGDIFLAMIIYDFMTQIFDLRVLISSLEP